MEPIESKKQYILSPEKIKEVKEFSDKLKIKEYKPFIFDEIECQIIFLGREDLDEDGDIWFSASNTISGYDIYIFDELSEETKKRKLFHELLEIDLLKQGVDSDIAHNIAKTEEEKIFGER